MRNILLSMGGANSIEQQIRNVVNESKPECLCVATAYLTQKGAEFLFTVASERGIEDVRIIAGLSGEVTHPNAIRFLQENSWDVRFGIQAQGTFHPKLLVGGERYSSRNGLVNPSGCYIGSANFTASGLKINTELGYTGTDVSIASEVAVAFKRLWDVSPKFSSRVLARYENRFSQRIQARSTMDLVDLGIVDAGLDQIASKGRKSTPVINAESASTMWVGLESFTGDYNFQVEIPATASEVLKKMLGTKARRVSIECADGEVRKMIYSYYSHNGMARLNVPNEVPLVQWARENKKGALVISQLDGHGYLYAEILRGRKLQEIQERSFALGTWGKTTTRYYGWY